MKLIKDKAIIIENINIQRADKLVTFYTLNRGLVKGVAEAARRIKSRFGSSFEPLTNVDISYLQHEEKELVTIRESLVISSISQHGKMPEHYFFIFYIMELAREFAVAGKNMRFYKLLYDIHVGIKKNIMLGLLARWAEIQFLHEHGVFSDWKYCTVCRKDMHGQTARKFLTVEGAFKCFRCAPSGAIEMKQDIFRLMNKLLYAKIAQLESVAADEKLLRKTGSILKIIIQHHTEKSLKFYEFYKQVSSASRSWTTGDKKRKD